MRAPRNAASTPLHNCHAVESVVSASGDAAATPTLPATPTPPNGTESAAGAAPDVPAAISAASDLCASAVPQETHPQPQSSADADRKTRSSSRSLLTGLPARRGAGGELKSGRADFTKYDT